MWLLFGVGALIACGICIAIASACSDRGNLGLFTFIFGVAAFAGGLSALVCFLIGIVRFAKWAWG